TVEEAGGGDVEDVEDDAVGGVLNPRLEAQHEVVVHEVDGRADAAVACRIDVTSEVRVDLQDRAGGASGVHGDHHVHREVARLLRRNRQGRRVGRVIQPQPDELLSVGAL